MTTSSTDQSVSRRPPRLRRAAAIAVSALAAGATLAGATAGLADASARPHAAGPGIDRILHIEVTRHGSPPDFRQLELEYFTANTRYLRTNDYSGRRLDYRTWQKDDLDTGHRFVDRVLVTPSQRDWYEETKTVPPLPPHSLGIRSSAEQVAHAIGIGKAHKEGLTRRDGQRVRLLTLDLGKHVGSAMLWVNPSTDQPVSETVGFLEAGGRSRTVRSDWEAASPKAVARLEAKPKPPAGYKVSRVHRNAGQANARRMSCQIERPRELG